MSKPIFRTNYSDAWRKFRQSKECGEILKLMAKGGIKPRYANNILNVAFVAGWGERKIVETNGQP
jgi:hypothetical protein